jgi:hypothetical protein
MPRSRTATGIYAASGERDSVGCVPATGHKKSKFCGVSPRRMMSARDMQRAGPVRSREQLVHKRRLITALAGRPERGLVRRFQPIQLLGNELVRLFPTDWHIVIGTGTLHHWSSERFRKSAPTLAYRLAHPAWGGPRRS